MQVGEADFIIESLLNDFFISESSIDREMVFAVPWQPSRMSLNLDKVSAVVHCEPCFPVSLVVLPKNLQNYCDLDVMLGARQSLYFLGGGGGI